VSRYIDTESELEALIPIYRPQPGKPDKQLDFVDAHARAFIATSPLVMLATTDPTGRLDVSPRGDPPGFVQVLDERHILIPDRKGNHRLDSLRNVLGNPRVGTLFVVPGREDTLRVNGRARITADAEKLQLCAVQGKVPVVAVEVEVDELYFHCSRSFLRGAVWQPEHWPDASHLATLGRALKDQMHLSYSAEEIDDDLAAANRDLY
jgi:PPOX class probable FMN-dependent enzyme